MRYYIRIRMLSFETPLGTPSCISDLANNLANTGKMHWQSVYQITRSVY